MKVVSVVGVTANALSAFNDWNEPREVAESMALALFYGCVFFATNTKIDADDRGIRVTAPHGVYALDWMEVKAVEVKALSTRFYADEKAVVYNLLFVGKGKRDLKVFVADMIQRHQIQRGRPPGIKNYQLGRVVRNARIRGWKLF